MDSLTPGLPVHHQLPEFTQPMSIESVMPSNHLILCHPLLLLPSIFPSIRVFSNESTLHIRFPLLSWKLKELAPNFSGNEPCKALICKVDLPLRLGKFCNGLKTWMGSPVPQHVNQGATSLAFHHVPARHGMTPGWCLPTTTSINQSPEPLVLSLFGNADSKWDWQLMW